MTEAFRVPENVRIRDGNNGKISEVSQEGSKVKNIFPGKQ